FSVSGFDAFQQNENMLNSPPPIPLAGFMFKTKLFAIFQVSITWRQDFLTQLSAGVPEVQGKSPHLLRAFLLHHPMVEGGRARECKLNVLRICTDLGHGLS
ncbi:Hypothetical predicted protein, partial [Marmota monax]